MSDDLISRQAAEIAFVEKGQLSRRYKLGEVWELNYEEIRDVLNDLPSVQPAQKTGRWIYGNCGDYVCSVCGWTFSDELPYMAREYDAETEEIMRYCMHCGAKMEV